MGTIKSSIIPLGAGLAGGFVGGYLAAKLSDPDPTKSQIKSQLAQAAAGIFGGMLVTKFAKSASAGYAFLGASVAGITHDAGARMGAGKQGTAALSAMSGLAATSENMGLLLSEGNAMNGMGLLMPGSTSINGLGDGALMDAIHEDGAR